MHTRCIVKRISVLSTALAVVLAASFAALDASMAAGQGRTDVKINTKKASATAPRDIGSLALTPGSLAPTHALEVHPYVAIPDTKDTHTQSVETKQPSR